MTKGDRFKSEWKEQDRVFDYEESYGIDDPDDYEEMDDELPGDLDKFEWDDGFEGIDDPDDYEEL